MFDTLMYAKKLEDVGIPRNQAETHIQIMTEVIEHNLATKSDIQILEHKLVEMEYRLTLKLGTIMVAGIAGLATLMTVLQLLQ